MAIDRLITEKTVSAHLKENLASYYEDICMIKPAIGHSAVLPAAPLSNDIRRYTVKNNGFDRFTQLLLHCDGTDNSSVFVDSSYYKRKITRTGTSVVLKTAVKKFGTASVRLMPQIGTPTHLNIPDVTGLDLSGGVYTFDFWFRNSTVPGINNTFYIYRHQNADTTPSHVTIVYFGSSLYNHIVLRFAVRDNDKNISRVHTKDVLVGTGAWHHVCICGAYRPTWPSLIGSPYWVRIYIDGYRVSKAEEENVQFLPPSGLSTRAWIGGVSPYTEEITSLNGYLDEFNLSVGVSRRFPAESEGPNSEPYSVRLFTPPTVPYYSTYTAYKTPDGVEHIVDKDLE